MAATDTRTPRPLRVAVVGCGHLGSLHARIYSENEGAELAYVVDVDPARASKVAETCGAVVLDDPALLPADLDAVSVAVPTVHHAEVAVPLLERGLATLVEKPFAATLEQADAMIAARDRGQALLGVGHVERFQPGLRKVREWNMKPRFLEVHRLAPFSFRSTDVGVVHDLMIHDLDLVLHLLGDCEVVDLDAAGGSILTDTEDLASVRLVFSNGARANVTASRASMTPMRRFRLFSAESYVSLDFHQNYGLLVRRGKGWDEGREKLARMDPAELAKVENFIHGGMMEVVELELSSEERPLQAELASFLEAVRAGRQPEVTGEDGRRALELAERITTKIREQVW